jgi:hypothetical protein
MSLWAVIIDCSHKVTLDGDLVRRGIYKWTCHYDVKYGRLIFVSSICMKNLEAWHET